MPGSILVIRGGALGDFVLTLPAIRLLRDSFPTVRIELLGYRQYAALVERRFYSDATRSIEYGPLAGFFARNGELDPGVSEYFAGFSQVISYLYDPDQIFSENVARCGVRNFLASDPRPPADVHAAVHLARPLERFAHYLEDAAARLFPSADDLVIAESILAGREGAVAIHPGSGSASKNWPLSRWVEVLRRLENVGTWIILGGEADGTAPDTLARSITESKRILMLNRPLTEVSAVLSRCVLYLGHDSGVSHVAAATGTPCVLLFGPTDPRVWAPLNSGVRVVAGAGGAMEGIDVEDVVKCVRDVVG